MNLDLLWIGSRFIKIQIGFIKNMDLDFKSNANIWIVL